MNLNYKRLKSACYATNVTMSIVGNLSPLLFLTFRSLYGISYSLLGLLVLINFCTQLIMDLVFTVYSHKFNISVAVKMTPVLTVIGLVIYAFYPFLFPNSVYVGLVLGTIVFSASSGLSEVLISPVIAAIPSDNPEREMSKLHSIYAWGVVFVVLFSTAFLLLFGSENWQYLAMLWLIVPFIAIVLYSGIKVPDLHTPEKTSASLKMLCNKELILCFLCIFFGGASECTMAQWSSSYIEQALSIPKVWGDVFGVALFAVMLGLGRTMYAKFGKHLNRVLFFGSVGAVLCYLIAAVSQVAVLGLAACALTGLCVSMLWPGSLLEASSRFPAGGVAVFALMAAGGDLGASVGPQFVGVITDAVMKNNWFSQLGVHFNLTMEQVGMKVGMFAAILFPLLATILFGMLWKTKKLKK